MTAEHLSALTCMKDLSLTFRWCTHRVMDISPLYALTSLERLWLQFKFPSECRVLPIWLGATLTALNALSQLYMSTVPGGVVLLDGSWECMPGLQSLTLKGWRLGCNQHLLGLSRLTALRCLNIQGCWSYDVDSAEYAGQLMRDVQQHCPWLDACIDACFSSASLPSPCSNGT